MSLFSKNLVFRAIEEKDLPLMIEWRNDPKNNYNFYEEEPLSLSTQKIWYDKYLKSLDNNKTFIVDEIASANTIGMASISHIDWRSRKAEYGRLFIDDAYRGKGYGKEIEKTIYAYVFDHLNLNRFYFEVFYFNKLVINLHQSMGSKIEGTLRQHVYRHGEYQDVVIMSILKKEYLKNKLEHKYD